jgi:membrane-bound serine protease (ClpP class)
MIVLLAQAQQAAADSANDAYLLWGFILAAAALGLLLIELLIPSGGLLGLLCGVSAIGSIIAFFQYDTLFGVAATAIYIVLTPILLVFIFKLWIHSPLAKRLILGGDTMGQTDGDQDRLKSSEKTRLKRLDELRQLIGAEGVTETALRPVGFVKINGQRLDAMAESGIVEADTPVVVTDVYDNQIKVRPRTP